MTKLFKSRVDYLGHTLSCEDIAMQEDYIARILDWPTPTTPKELLALLGFFGYYRTFIPEYASLTYDMNKQKTAKELAWTEVMDTQLALLKDKFRQAPIRAPRGSTCQPCSSLPLTTAAGPSQLSSTSARTGRRG